jgi:hypothetical protein
LISAARRGHHFSDKPNGFRPWRTDSNCNRGIRAERGGVGNATLAIEPAVQMRDRRLLRAEERANQLPVKMVGRWGLFYFQLFSALRCCRADSRR